MVRRLALFLYGYFWVSNRWALCFVLLAVLGVIRATGAEIPRSRLIGRCQPARRCAFAGAAATTAGEPATDRAVQKKT